MAALMSTLSFLFTPPPPLELKEKLTQMKSCPKDVTTVFLNIFFMHNFIDSSRLPFN